jgi:hypothetical protein
MDGRYGGWFSFFNEDVQREILSYLTVGERYGIKTTLLLKFVRQHTTRAGLHQPVIPYYSNIRHTRNMPCLWKRKGSLGTEMRFNYRHVQNQFQIDLAILRDYDSYHTDHIDYDWKINIHPPWKLFDKDGHDYIHTACKEFDSPYIRNLTRMCYWTHMFLDFRAPRYTGYFIPKEPMVTHQHLLQTAYGIMDSLSKKINERKNKIL